MLRFSKLFLLAAALMSSLSLCVVPSAAYAVSGADWKAGRIIDEEIFFRPGTMSDADIQNFLNTKVPVCDTWGTKTHWSGQTRAQYGASKGSPAPYICLKNYTMTYGEKNDQYGYCKYIPGGSGYAAEIINRVANACGINPQALIVLLEKEQGLVSDDWPWPIQYRGATGYGCPDTAPCDAEYYGFFNQLYNAAWQFKSYVANPGGFRYKPFQNNSIYWSPNLSCGAADVYIQNQITAGLYNYTPYQPNAAALNNLYGEGDGCSAYGNRNFWRLFNDWFGYTTGAGDLITDNSSGIYYISNGYKYHIPSMQEFYNYGFRDSDISRINRVSSGALAAIPSNPNNKNISVVVASARQGVFVISNGNKYYIPSMPLFYAFGFKDADIVNISEESMNRFVTAANSLNTIISDPRGFTYRVENGERRGIFQPYVLNRYPDAPKGSKLSDITLSRIKAGVPIVDGKLTLLAEDGTYFTVGDRWYKVSKRSIASCNGSNDVVSFNSTQGRPGAVIAELKSCFVKDGNGAKYLLDGSMKHSITDNEEIPYIVASNYDHFTTLPTTNSKNIFANNEGIFELQKGKARHIMSMAYVKSVLGDTLPPLLKTNSLVELPADADLYSNRTLLSSASGGIHVLIGGRLSYVGSMGQFYAYGFKLSNLLTVSDSDLNMQERGANLPGAKVSDATGAYLISGGRKHKVDGPDVEAFGGLGAFSEIDSTFLATLPQANATRFIATKNNSGIYYIESGKRRYISSWDKFIQMGGSEDKVTVVDEYTFKSFEVGEKI